MSIRKLLALAALTFTPMAHASPALPPATIQAIAATLPRCTGGWHSDAVAGQVMGPAQLAPRLALLARPSTALSDDEAEDLYEIGKAMLYPAVGSPKWLIDGGGFLKCPALPREALALIEYLVGDAPGDRRGPNNAFDLLGLAYQTGAAGPADPARARIYYLRGRIHWRVLGHDSWSDGKDNNLLANIERAGLRPYLDTLAGDARSGGSARLILAEDALPRDPARARNLMLHPDSVTLGPLLDWETQGRIAPLADGSDVAVWAQAARKEIGYPRWILRMIEAAERANGGPLPTLATPSAIARLRPTIDPEQLSFVSPTATAIPARALVDRTGRALYTEACRPASGGALDLHDRLAVARIYDPERLPPLPVARIAGRPAFGWVLLPAVTFRARGDGKVGIGFAPTTPESCVRSAMDGPLPPPPVAPPIPSN